jgi:hypothetical protein
MEPASTHTNFSQKTKPNCNPKEQSMVLRTFKELELAEFSHRVPADAGAPHPQDPVWPLDPRAEWRRFQDEWAEHIKPPANLVGVYEMVLALAIDRKMRSEKP